MGGMDTDDVDGGRVEDDACSGFEAFTDHPAEGDVGEVRADMVFDGAATYVSVTANKPDL